MKAILMTVDWQTISAILGKILLVVSLALIAIVVIFAAIALWRTILYWAIAAAINFYEWFYCPKYKLFAGESQYPVGDVYRQALLKRDEKWGMLCAVIATLVTATLFLGAAQLIISLIW